MMNQGPKNRCQIQTIIVQNQQIIHQIQTIIVQNQQIIHHQTIQHQTIQYQTIAHPNLNQTQILILLQRHHRNHNRIQNLGPKVLEILRKNNFISFCFRVCERVELVLKFGVTVM